jgi:hypothetical protein
MEFLIFAAIAWAVGYFFLPEAWVKIPTNTGIAWVRSKIGK